MAGPVSILVYVALGTAWATILLLAWFVYQLVEQNGRLLLRVEALEGIAPTAATDEPVRAVGLASGTVLHDFELPRVDDGTTTLSQWRGRRVLLIFVDP